MPQPALNRPSPALLQRLCDIVGEANVIADPVRQERYLKEWRDRYFGATPLVVRPASTADVAAVLFACNQERVGVVPQSGNTGLVGGQIPHEDGSEILLSLDRLTRIRGIDATKSSLLAEAGVTLKRVQEAAAAAGRLFPVSMASEGSCCIGGNIATNAGGIAVVAYGTMRTQVLGLEVVLADGRVWSNLDGLKKDNTGYDLRDLFVGSEGTLGIITAATLKLHPRPRGLATAFASVADASLLPALFSLAEAHAGSSLTAFEFMSQRALEFVLRHGARVSKPCETGAPWFVLIELATLEEDRAQSVLETLLVSACDAGLIADVRVATTGAQREALWRLREQMSDVQKQEGGSIKHDISVPLARIPEFLDRAEAIVTRLVPGARTVPFGHLGDGNIHYNVSQPPDMPKHRFLAQWDQVSAAVHDLVVELGGSISAEHGIGRMKRAELRRVKDPLDLDLMRRIKDALDPHGILNPGKVL
jgi:FAD/FMN-containing dehydrogenase